MKNFRIAVLLGGVTAFAGLPWFTAAREAWTQWGGPTKDFVAPSNDLASKWGPGGPAQLWQRSLGEGYSAVLVDQGRLYTMFRREETEVVAALDETDGSTVWEFSYPAAPREGHVNQFGRGPRSTPLIADGRIFSIGIAGKMHALSTEDGSEIWSHDLWGEQLAGNFLNHGYSSSPIAFADTIIALVGGENASVVAFDPADGSIRWQSQSFGNSYSTPRIFEVGGEPQLIAMMARQIIGLDPSTGELEWSFPCENQWQQNVSMPTVVDGEYLFFSSPQAGAHGLRLTKIEGSTETRVDQLWSTRKIQFYHVTTVRQGDWVYGTTGLRDPAFLAAINVKTGEIGWRERGFSKSNIVAADGKLFILEESGKLTLATATPQQLQIQSQVELLERVAWTAPTIVGSKMYLRDQTKIIALDLS